MPLPIFIVVTHVICDSRERERKPTCPPFLPPGPVPGALANAPQGQVGSGTLHLIPKNVPMKHFLFFVHGDLSLVRE